MMLDTLTIPTYTPNTQLHQVNQEEHPMNQPLATVHNDPLIVVWVTLSPTTLSPTTHTHLSRAAEKINADCTSPYDFHLIDGVTASQGWPLGVWLSGVSRLNALHSAVADFLRCRDLNLGEVAYEDDASDVADAFASEVEIAGDFALTPPVVSNEYASGAPLPGCFTPFTSSADQEKLLGLGKDGTKGNIPKFKTSSATDFTVSDYSGGCLVVNGVDTGLRVNTLTVRFLRNAKWYWATAISF